MRYRNYLASPVFAASLLTAPVLGVLSTPAAAVNLCAPGALTPSVVEMVMDRSDFDEIISQMSATCPRAALELTNAATAAGGGNGDPGPGDPSEPPSEPEPEPEPPSEPESEDSPPEKEKGPPSEIEGYDGFDT